MRTAAVEEYSHTHNRPVFTQDTGSMADRVAARIMFTFIIAQCTHNILQWTAPIYRGIFALDQLWTCLSARIFTSQLAGSLDLSSDRALPLQHCNIHVYALCYDVHCTLYSIVDRTEPSASRNVRSPPVSSHQIAPAHVLHTQTRLRPADWMIQVDMTVP